MIRQNPSGLRSLATGPLPYTPGAAVITTNLEFSRWTEVFGDATLRVRSWTGSPATCRLCSFCAVYEEREERVLRSRQGILPQVESDFKIMLAFTRILW